MKEKTSARDVSLQARIQEMEAEKSRRVNELRQLKQSKISVRKICCSLHDFSLFVGCLKKDVAQTAQHNEQHLTSPLHNLLVRHQCPQSEVPSAPLQ